MTHGQNLPEPVVSAVQRPESARHQSATAGRNDGCRPFRRVWLMTLLLILCLGSMVGCGTESAFTGGGVPIGKSRITGKVLLAFNPQIGVSRARITVIAYYAGYPSQTLEATTDLNGVFDIPQIPTGTYTANVQVHVEPNDPTLRAENLNFLVANGHTANLIVALAPTDFDVSKGVAVTLTPPTAAVRPGESVKFTALVRQTDGSALPVTPTLLFNDDFGSINPDGTFVGKNLGTGNLSAYWYGNLRATANVIVDPTANPQPPSPPTTHEK